MPIFKDQMQRIVEVPEQVQRIVSLVPSQTELLFDFGLGEKIVGVTKFCVHPHFLRKEKVVIGGTKSFHPDRIRELRPDLIIGNKEENYKGGIEALEKDFPVWMSDIFSLVDALRMIEQLGAMTNTAGQAKQFVQQIQKGFCSLNPLAGRVSCLYLIWRDPFMGVGENTFIDDLLCRCGFRNVLSAKGRYPQITAGDLEHLAPRLIMLSSEPYPFREKHVNEIKSLCPGAEVVLVDGEMFSWYGSRLLKTVSYLQALLPELALRLKV